MLENNDKFTVQTEIANYIDRAEVREMVKEEHMYALAKKLAEMLEEAPGIFARLEPVEIFPAPRTDSILMRHVLKIRGCVNCRNCKYAEGGFKYPVFLRFCTKWNEEVPANGFCYRGIPSEEENL